MEKQSSQTRPVTYYVVDGVIYTSLKAALDAKKR